VTSVAGDGLSDSHNYNRATRLLLARVPVIAVGNAIATPQNLHRSGASSNGQKSSQNQPIVVTVAVNQHDAEKLIEAIQTGYLYFGLLTTESHVDPGAGVNSANLFN
jgi:pilus assembly protein CpaB